MNCLAKVIKIPVAYWDYMFNLNNPQRFFWIAVMVSSALLMGTINHWLFSDSDLGISIALISQLFIYIPIHYSVVAPRLRKKIK
jgi:hypothetical protein